MSVRHELPTHLGVEDRVFGSLTMSQLMVLLCGLVAGYGAWQQLPDVAPGIRAGLGGGGVLLASALALIRPADRGLATWALALLRYATLPKTAVWRPCPPESADRRADQAAWAAFTPHLTWEKASGAQAAPPPCPSGSEAAGRPAMVAGAAVPS